ncbi:hypothetical protein [Massilia sp. LjRoot122]
MSELVQHVKKVAKQDFRDFFAPIVAAYKFVKRDIRRPATR